MKIPKDVEVMKIWSDRNFPRKVWSEKIITITNIIIRIINDSLEYFILWIFLETIFEMYKVSMNANIPEIIIVKVMRNRLFKVKSGNNFETATAAPVLVLWIE